MVLFLKHVVFNGILDLYQCPILGPVGTFTELLTCSIGLCKIATVSKYIALRQPPNKCL